MATSEMPPDSPIEDIASLASDYPDSPLDTPSTLVHLGPPPHTIPKSSFVFNSSTSREWARDSSVGGGRPTLSALPSFYSEMSSADSTLSLGSSTSQLSSWSDAGSIGHKSHGGNWQRSREYQTRLTAGECFEHAFSSSKQAREWEMLRSATSKSMAPARPSAGQFQASGLCTFGGTSTLTRRRSSGLTLTYELALRSKDCSAAPPKGTFRSGSRLTDRRHSDYNLPLSHFQSGSETLDSQSSSPSISPTSASSSSSPDSLSILYSSVGTSAAVREPLLSREDWEKASTRRTEQRRRSREVSCPCSATNRDSDFPLYTNVEPISISGQSIGGWIGLENAPTEEIRRHHFFSKNIPQSQARHPFQDLKPRSPESLYSDHGRDKAFIRTPDPSVEDRAGRTYEEKRTDETEDEDILTALQRTEIFFSQLSLYLRMDVLDQGLLTASGG